MSNEWGRDSGPTDDVWGASNQAWSQVGSVSRDWTLQPAQVASSTEPVPVATQVDAQPAPAMIEEYRVSRRKAPIVIAVVVVAAVLAGLLWISTRTARDTETTTSSTPTPSKPTYTPTAPLPTGGEFTNSINFTASQGSGIFAIEESRWEGGTLVVRVNLKVSSGSLEYGFLSMDMSSGDVSLPDKTRGDLTEGTVTAGQEISGTVRFTKARADTQIILSDMDARNNVTMLAVKG